MLNVDIKERPDKKNNNNPGINTSKPASWQFRADQPRFFATEAKILAQKNTLTPTQQSRAQIKPMRLVGERVGRGKARIPKHPT